VDNILINAFIAALVSYLFHYFNEQQKLNNKKAGMLDELRTMGGEDISHKCAILDESIINSGSKRIDIPLRIHLPVTDLYYPEVAYLLNPNFRKALSVLRQHVEEFNQVIGQVSTISSWDTARLLLISARDQARTIQTIWTAFDVSMPPSWEEWNKDMKGTSKALEE